MAQRTLSKGTLNLRFMQNARRAQQLPAVELDKAEIKDDAEWEVSQEMKNKWGTSSSTTTKMQNVTYETSYLPFLFPHASHQDGELGAALQTTDSRISKPKGRRSFNRKGEEVNTQQETTEPSKEAVNLTKLSGISGSGSVMQQPKPARPQSISAANAPAKKHKDPTKEARRVVFDNGNVGSDLRATSRANGNSAPATAGGFMKPAGVDGPSRPRNQAGLGEAEDKKPPSGFVKPAGVDGPSRPAKDTAVDEKKQLKTARKKTAKRNADEDGGKRSSKKAKLALVE
ncbi:hypothetical protein CONPUDRAFT_146417 [Coniophora puteana RWD-64-598 SS2]|uniref:Uncharacterized protein n=1 Tax=Coniophora puteana (strain RWD-64-598) TaxID=741705 RepID=A0A5M3MBG4_CONPW|nr:uncharacterized protein CONPUDRAFT_146417 [Coniophora puteana RWD-64-598 SS2]EIW76572.1 hypothetical protein CONPUDRAFT_146417 [Coniophora puteana RWD-64-598 SS2]